MTYQYGVAQVIKADAPQHWAWECNAMVGSLMRTALLALENDNSGLFSDEARMNAAARTLEVAIALADIVDEGTDMLERAAECGTWRKKEAAE